MKTLPYHQSERCFRKYEDAIAAIVTNLPSISVVKCPNGLAQTTYIARLRDAIKSYRHHEWPTTTLDKEKMALYPTIAVAVKGDKIIAGTRHDVTHYNPKPLDSHIDEDGILEPFSIGTQMPLALYVIAELAANKVLLRPVRFLLADAAPNFIPDLQDNYDIIITPNIDGSYTLE